MSELPVHVARPLAPYGLAYARIEVPDIDASVAWYGYHVGLAPVGGHGDRVFLRHGTSHHSLELVPAPQRSESWTVAAGYTVQSPAVLESLRARVEAAGLAVGSLDESVKGLCREGFSVVDPNGFVIELLLDFDQFAVPPDVELAPIDVVHPFLSTDRFDESMAFYIDVLGFQASDHIVGSTSFLRSENRYHHSLALRRDDRFYVAHVCFLMQNFDHVMRRRARALYKKVPLPADMMNHSASGSIATYLHDAQHGPRIELCDGHIVFDAEKHETHQPRFMSADPRNIDVWRAAADDWAGF
jgi:catechol-2,3-dioxygenase